MKHSAVLSISILLVVALAAAGSGPAQAQDPPTQQQLIEMAEFLRGRRAAAPRVLAVHAPQEECGTEAWRQLEELLASPALSRVDRDEVLAVFDIVGTVSTWETAHFTIDYTVDDTEDQVQGHDQDTAGDVHLTDDPGFLIGSIVAGNGVPDFIETLGIWLEYALGEFRDVGFYDPVPVGKFQVYVEDIPYLGLAGSTRIKIDNELPAYYMQATPAHELFHVVQRQYATSRPVWISEGTARWSVDMINDNLNRYMAGTRAYLQSMDQNLTESSYNAVLFWKYFSEQHTAVHSEPIVGADAIQTLFEMLESFTGLEVVEEAVRALPNGRSMRHTHADWLIACYLKDLGDPYVHRGYDFFEDEEGNFGTVVPVASYSLTATSGPFSASETVNDWGADYYVIEPDGTVDDLRIAIDADAAFADPLFVVLAVKDDVATIYRSRSASFEKVLHNPPLDELVVIVGASETGGSYELEIEANSGIPVFTPIDVTLVIDASGSMPYYGYLTPTKQYGKLFVDLLQPEDRIGVVSFTTRPDPAPDAVVDYPLSEIPATTPPDVAAEARQALEDLTAGNRTPIGAGLLAAHEQLVSLGDPAHPQAIVLLSDGEENEEPFVSTAKDPDSTILSDLNADGISVHTLILGQSADWAMDLLSEIAQKTDGHSQYFLLTDLDFAEVFMAIRAAILQDDLLRLDRGEVGSPGGTGVEHSVTTDASASLLLFSAAWEEPGSALEVELQPPGSGPDDWLSADEIAAEPAMTVHQGEVYQVVRVSDPAPGKWGYRVRTAATGAAGEEYVLGVVTDRLDVNLTVATDGTLVAGDPLLLTANLTHRGTPIAGAEVNAVVQVPRRSLSTLITTLWQDWPFDSLAKAPPTASELTRRVEVIEHLRQQLGDDALVEYDDQEVTLHDSGQGGDLRAGDGVYSARLPDTQVAGSYRFKIRAEADAPLPFEREAVLAAQIDVAAIDPDKSIVDLSAVAMQLDGSRTMEIVAVGVDRFGNTMWPGLAGEVEVATDAGQLAGGVVDNQDTSYSQLLELGRDEDGEVTVTLRGVQLPPASTIKPTYAWHLYLLGGQASPRGALSSALATGDNLIVGLGYSLSYNLELRGLLGVNRFEARAPATDDEEIVNLSGSLLYSFRRGRVEPYFGGGLGAYFLEQGGTELGAHLSAGLQIDLTRRLALDIGSDLHRIFDRRDSRFLHVHAGLAFHF